MSADVNLEVLVVVLAGGEGSRLWPLTEFRSKPAVPIGGKYRLIDIPLSNAFNSRFRKILVLTQGKDKSLNRHIKNTWSSDFKSGSVVDVISPQGMGTVYAGDADAVRQVAEDIRQYSPDIVLVVPGDHLLRMNYYNFVRALATSDADAAIAVFPKPLDQARFLGSLAIDSENRIIDFREKDPNTPLRAHDDGSFFASMGIYAFRMPALSRALELNGDLFGRHLIPQLLGSMKILGYDYQEYNRIPEMVKVLRDGLLVDSRVEAGPDSNYWRDVGTISEYFEANMDLVSISPRFNLYGQEWPFYTYLYQHGPAKVIRPERRGVLDSALCAEGSVLSDVVGRDVVVSPDVFIDKSRLEEVIIFHNSRVQRCNVRRTIIDKNVRLANMEIGFSEDYDRDRGIYVDPESGIRVVRKFYDSRDPDSWRVEKPGVKMPTDSSPVM
jgi:glucose-1-phosphate adenylyltransferase